MEAPSQQLGVGIRFESGAAIRLQAYSGPQVPRFILNFSLNSHFTPTLPLHSFTKQEKSRSGVTHSTPTLGLLFFYKVVE